MRRHRRDSGADESATESATAIAAGKRSLSESLPAQRKAAPTPAAPSADGGTMNRLPGATRAKMEDAFDFSFARVQVQEGDAAPAMGAQAYTQGTDVHFAPGAYAPGTEAGDRLIGHELAHVVQQSEGRVAATTQAKGVAMNDDDHLEREADEWGERAARGEPIARASSTSVPPAAMRDAGPTQRKGVIQRSPVSSHQGKFIDKEYTTVTNGVAMQLEFEPGPSVDAKKIGFTQSVNYSVGGKPVITDPAEVSHIVPSGKPGAGSMIDRITTNTDPIYGSTPPSTDKLSDTAATNAPSGVTPSKSNATYKLGHRFKEGEAEKKDNAWMYDKPEGDGTKNASMEFETTALAIEGAQSGTYYGSVKWGWKRDASGTLSKIPFAIISQGVPSATFLSAAATWNAATARGTIVTIAADTTVYDGSLTEKFKVGKDQKVTIDGAAGAGGEVYESITVVGGTHDGKTGYIKLSALKDKGDGKATIDLPTPDVHVLVADEEVAKGVTWPKGTRVAKTGAKAGTKVAVRVVDGTHIGKEGTVEAANLKDEVP